MEFLQGTGNGLYVREANFDPILKVLVYGMRFDPTMFAEVFKVRVWLELAVIEDAVQQINEDDLVALDSLMIDWQERVDKGQSYTDIDELYHRILYRPLANQTLIMLLKVFWDAFENLANEAIRMADHQLVVNDHLYLLEAIKLRDPKLCKERLLYHFSHVDRRIADALN